MEAGVAGNCQEELQVIMGLEYLLFFKPPLWRRPALSLTPFRRPFRSYLIIIIGNTIKFSKALSTSTTTASSTAQSSANVVGNKIELVTKGIDSISLLYSGLSSGLSFL